jgi:hypothetical protein
MSLEDGNNNTPQAPAIDENRIINGLFDRFQEANNRAPNQQERDTMELLYHSLKNQNMDDAFIDSQMLSANLLEKGITSKVDRKLDERLAQVTIGQAINGARSYIKSQLRSYYKEEPRLKEMGELLESRVAAKFDASDANRRALARGTYDTETIDGIIESVVDDVSQKVLGMDKAKNLNVNKGNAAAKQEATRADNEEDSKKTSVDSLNDEQLEFYNARVVSLQRYQGKTADEAKKIAFEAARALPPQPARRAAR